MRDSDDPVPLWSAGGGWRDFVVFTGVMVRRFSQYVLNVFFAADKAVKLAFSLFIKVKRFFIFLLLRRRGFFAPVQRVGFLTLSSTAFLSLVLVPSFSSLTTSYQLKQIMGAANYAGEAGEVLAAATDTLIEQTAPAVVKPSDPSRQQILEHTVASGETLGSIGEQYLVSVEALSYVNNISAGKLIHPGDKVLIPPVDGLIYKVKAGDSIATIATRHNVSPQAIVDANLVESPFIIHSGDELVIPGGTVPAPKPVYLASQPSRSGGLSLQSLPGTSGSGSLTMPTVGPLTQYFSWYHPAIDIANGSCGSPIVAADSGTITFAGWWVGGGGNSIFINHGNGLITKYAHMSRFARTGGAVGKGEVIGYTGATGRAYGCHLHYVVQQNGRAVNPLNF